MKKGKKLILGTTTKKDQYKYVGTNLPPRTYNYLTLYILAYKIAKSNLFKKLIDDWMEQNVQDGNTELELIHLIIERVNYEYSQLPDKSKLNIDKFKKSIQLELMNKGLKLKQVTKILENIKE